MYVKGMQRRRGSGLGQGEAGGKGHMLRPAARKPVTLLGPYADSDDAERIRWPAGHCPCDLLGALRESSLSKLHGGCMCHKCRKRGKLTPRRVRHAKRSRGHFKNGRVGETGTRNGRC